jgi:hypothetical protein
LGLKQSEVAEKYDARVWFLTGGYQSTITTRSFITPGNFYILAPLYSVSASQAEYPSLDSTDKLNEYCEHDMANFDINNSVATLDGNRLTSNQIKIQQPFSLDLPRENIIGLSIPKRQSKKTISIVSIGYWIWLKPLPLGDHRIHLSATAPQFVSELNVSLTVAGPK